MLKKPSFQNTVRDLAQAFSPTVMIISKTKVGRARAKSISNHLPFNGAIHANTIGLTSGLWVLWDSTQVEISELASQSRKYMFLSRYCPQISLGIFLLSMLVLGMLKETSFGKTYQPLLLHILFHGF